jgi:hypothetical protein
MATSVTSHPFGSDDLISGIADNRRQLAASRASDECYDCLRGLVGIRSLQVQFIYLHVPPT